MAPDNGVLGYVMSSEKAWSAIHLTESDYWLPQISHTFHGRDVFAPVAAHLARGVAFERLGEHLLDPILCEMPPVRQIDDHTVRATVLYIDRFGNVVTNLPADMPLAGGSVNELGHRLGAQVAGHTLLGLHAAYGDVSDGEYLLLIGSSGFVEIARCGGNAAKGFDLHSGDSIAFEITATIPRMSGKGA